MAESKAQKKEQQKKPEPKKKDGPNYYAIALALVVAALILGAFYVLSNSATVPFSTFKSNFDSAPRVAVTATSYNNSQYNDESPCFSSIIQVIAHNRKPSTIDFFILNQTACTYSSTGLGGQVVPVTTNTSYCLNIARSEPGVFLNYSNTDRIAITPYRLYVYGNSSYMSSCSIAIELD